MKKKYYVFQVYVTVPDILDLEDFEQSLEIDEIPYSKLKTWYARSEVSFEVSFGGYDRDDAELMLKDRLSEMGYLVASTGYMRELSFYE